MSVIKQEYVELPLHVLPHDHKAAKTIRSRLKNTRTQYKHVLRKAVWMAYIIFLHLW
jgi:hypothetical protein